MSRTGYTGEDGFEVLVEAAHAVELWQAITETGQAYGLLPVGLGARDTLRLEARYLSTVKIWTRRQTPFEVGLGWITKLDKGEFIGRDALTCLKATGVQRRMIGFIMQERGIPRAHYQVMQDEQVIGEVTSGTMSPTLGQAIGTALVRSTSGKIGSTIAVEIRHKAVPARVVCLPPLSRAASNARSLRLMRKQAWNFRRICATPRSTSGARQEGNRVVVGITDYAQKELGDIVFVELPEVGTTLAATDTFGVVESVKAVSDLYAPVSGTIVEANTILEDQPELVNASPYGQGWMIIIEAAYIEELQQLLTAAEYQAYVAQEKSSR